MTSAALRLTAVLVATTHGGSGDANGNALCEHDKVNVRVRRQKHANRRFDGLRVGGEGDGLIAHAQRRILALHREYVSDMPFERIIPGDGFGNWAVLVDDKQHLVGAALLWNVWIARQGQQRQQPKKYKMDETVSLRTKSLHVAATTTEPLPLGKSFQVPGRFLFAWPLSNDRAVGAGRGGKLKPRLTRPASRPPARTARTLRATRMHDRKTRAPTAGGVIMPVRTPVEAVSADTD